MADPTTVTSLKVYYSDGGQTLSKTIRFKGNFGFSLDRQNSNGASLQKREYKVKDGHVYDSNGKLVQGLKMPKAMAYQFIGMSNTAEVNAHTGRDYTYTASDMTTANEKFSYGGNSALINAIVGSGATSGVQKGYANYRQEGEEENKKNVYSTNYHHRVSVWQE